MGKKRKGAAWKRRKEERRAVKATRHEEKTAHVDPEVRAGMSLMGGWNEPFTLLDGGLDADE